MVATLGPGQNPNVTFWVHVGNATGNSTNTTVTFILTARSVPAPTVYDDVVPQVRVVWMRATGAEACSQATASHLV